jgi:solute carrier family 25 phosphate transporter 3
LSFGMATAASTSTGSTKLDTMAQRTISPPAPQMSGLQLYSRFAFAGAVCCSVTHGALTPVDV